MKVENGKGRRQKDLCDEDSRVGETDGRGNGELRQTGVNWPSQQVDQSTGSGM